jgi:hypothetical protein
VKSLLGRDAFKSLGIPEDRSYDDVASEYYDEDLHPTCADFRLASRIYLRKLFELSHPDGRIADVGCGRSLVANFRKEQLVLIDKSARMLAQNLFALETLETRLIDVEKESIGASEFDWIFAILGDPYNTPEAWHNLAEGLKVGGQCVFIVPASEWARKFRLESVGEKPNLARFLTSKGEIVFLPSLVVEPEIQKNMIANAGLHLVAIERVLVGDLPFVRSPKISKVLSGNQCLLDVYRAKRL